MVDGASSLVTMIYGLLGAGLWQDRRAANLLDGGAPFYDTYACADGRHVAVGALEPQFYAALRRRASGSPTRSRAGSTTSRTGPSTARLFAEAFATRTRDEWAAAFEGTDACVDPGARRCARRRRTRTWPPAGTFVELDGVPQPGPGAAVLPHARRRPRRRAPSRCRHPRGARRRGASPPTRWGSCWPPAPWRQRRTEGRRAPVADEVLVERRDGVQVITINRPEAKNALDRAVAEGVAAAVDELDASDDLRVGVLTGAGGTFSAGMDLKAFLRGETPAIEGRGLCGITQTPPRKPLIARGRGLGPGRRLRAAAGLRPDRRGGDRAVRRARGEALAGRRRGSGAAAAAAGAVQRRAGDAADRRPAERRPGGRARPGQPAHAPRARRSTGALELAATIAANGPLAVAATKAVARGSADWTFDEGWDGAGRAHRAGVRQRGRPRGRDRLRGEAPAGVEGPLTASSADAWDGGGTGRSEGAGHAGRSDRRGRPDAGRQAQRRARPACTRSTCRRTCCTRWCERTGIDPALVDDVIWGCVSQVGEQTFDIARTAVLAAGWPESVPGVTIDRQCGSSQQAVHFAAAGLIAGQYDVVVAGGVESMSRVPMGSTVTADGRPPVRRRRTSTATTACSPNQGVGAEMIAEQWGLSRHAARRVLRAPRTRRPRPPAPRAASTRRSRRSRCPTAPWSARTRASAAAAPWRSWPRCKTRSSPDGVITAGNASQISDGAAALLVTTSEKAPRARADARSPGCTPPSLAGDDPVMMLTAPIPATAQGAAAQRACASTTSARSRSTRRSRRCRWPGWPRLGADPQGAQPHGGAIALGHPLGGSGARLMTTLVHHMRDNGIRYGLQTMCEGGGMANATILELL